MMSWLTPILKMLKLMLNDIVMRYRSVFFQYIDQHQHPHHILFVFYQELFLTMALSFLGHISREGGWIWYKMQNLEPLFHIPTHPQWNMACSKQFWEETWDGKYILEHCSEWFKFELLFNILPSVVRMMIIIATILMMMFTQNTMIHTT